MKDKKGMFFTLSAIFIITILAAVYISSSSVRLKMDKNFALDRAQEISSSLESNIREIISVFKDPNVLIEKSAIDGTINVTFRDTISRDKENWGTKLEDSMNSFKQFVESEEPNVKLNVDKMINDKELPLTISPYNITYFRSWGIGHVILGVEPLQNLTFKTYEVKINSTTTRIDKVQTNFKAAGNLLLKVTAVDNYGNNIVKEKLVDPSDSHTIQVFFVNGNKVKVDLNANNLETWTNVDSNLIVDTKIGLLPPQDDKTSVKFFADVVNVTFSDLGVEKLGSIAITEG